MNLAVILVRQALVEVLLILLACWHASVRRAGTPIAVSRGHEAMVCCVADVQL